MNILFEYDFHPAALAYAVAADSGTWITNPDSVPVFKAPLPRDGGVVGSSVIEYNPGQPEKALAPIDVIFAGIVISAKEAQFEKALSPMDVRSVKYCSSLKEVMLWSLNTFPKSVTAAASSNESSPSLFISQVSIHIAFTSASANSIGTAPGYNTEEARSV